MKAFSRLAETAVIDPLEFPGVKPTGARAPNPIPEAAVARAAAFAPDVVICLGGGLFLPDSLASAFSRRVLTVGIALSDPQALSTSLKIAPHFDLFYTQDPQTLPTYRAAGIPARRLDLAVDPEAFYPMAEEKECDIVFVGKWTPYRDQLLSALAQVLTVRVFAHAGEQRWNVPVEPPLNDEVALCLAFNRARLSLDVALVEDAEPPFRGTSRITPRSFMAAACGVPTLIDETPTLGDYFLPGEEVAPFRTIEEAVATARWLREHPDACASMGARARTRVLSSHTWAHRAAAVLADVRCLLEQRSER